MRRWNVGPFAGCATAMVAMYAACGGGSGPVTPPPSPDFRLSLSPTALSVGVGDTSSPLTVSVSGLNGFTGSVSVAIDGLPAGATSSPAAPLSLQAGDSETVSFSIPVEAGEGSTSVTFHATSGSLSHDSNLALTVIPCLTGGTEVEIQAALDSANGFADLCPGATFIVNGTIRMGSAYSTGNRIFTAGYPTELSEKALIKVADHADAWSNGDPMINAIGDDIRIQNIQLDGNRKNNTVKPGSALVFTAGDRNLIDGIYGIDPLGAPAISAGFWPCSDLTLTHNFIGSVGGISRLTPKLIRGGEMGSRCCAIVPTSPTTKSVTRRT